MSPRGLNLCLSVSTTENGELTKVWREGGRRGEKPGPLQTLEESLHFVGEETQDLPRDAAHEKALGHAAFVSRNYDAAIQHYNTAFALTPDRDTGPRAVLLSNRAACHLALENLKAAAADARSAATLDPLLVKAHHRFSRLGKRRRGAYIHRFGAHLSNLAQRDVRRPRPARQDYWKGLAPCSRHFLDPSRNPFALHPLNHDSVRARRLRPKAGLLPSAGAGLNSALPRADHPPYHAQVRRTPQGYHRRSRRVPHRLRRDPQRQAPSPARAWVHEASPVRMLTLCAARRGELVAVGVSCPLRDLARMDERRGSQVAPHADPRCGVCGAAGIGFPRAGYAHQWIEGFGAICHLRLCYASWRTRGLCGGCLRGWRAGGRESRRPGQIMDLPCICAEGSADVLKRFSRKHGMLSICIGRIVG
ncbi:hypothetical protein BDK51DRAFT_53253 [Blyttiomyces helicus]|uniref:Uncharacterized protein n=1 Tax=Blyttiomyces helicus TaxID=388810 RepID=A0A4P9WJU7_9FUNG|nr:hypothetical protein BDK51DRAFT_53253 [Blyttiomyces helicus]|eukprot:RKO93221.1 hypothetical protein BDK51DRAFT_53253 [Blyttiomyces helicus]